MHSVDSNLPECKIARAKSESAEGVTKSVATNSAPLLCPAKVTLVGSPP